MDINELETYRLSDAIKYHDRLNPRLWGRDEHLLPEVREKLLEIAQDFQEFLGIDVDIQDITISGSNAAYTYTDHSDIDLHLVVDLPRADSDEVYRELFDAKKYQYNDRNDFRIGGYDVELYVQDPRKPHHSQGIYSVKNDQWIDVPKRRKPAVDDVSVRSKYEDLGARIESAIESGDLDQMDAMAAKLKDLRAAGLADTGEFGPENLAFKILRNNGTLERLSAARKAARDRRMSLAERKKKKTKKRKKYAYGGYWYPGYHYYGDTAAATDGGGDGGGESVQESQQESQQQTIERFARSCSDFLGMERCPRIKLRRDPQWSRVNRTFGRYSPDTRSIELAVAGRHIQDVLRTLAHEMTHARQDEVIGLPQDAGETGSTYEDQANALAGQIMRHWAESEPEMFAGQQLDEQLDRPTPTASEIIRKHNITEKDLIDQLKKGIAVEMEHTRDPQAALEIALDHLNERPDYYDMLASVERPMGEGMREKIAGLATAACIAGTPGCATTDALKTVQTIGRASQNISTRAGAEEELRTAVKDVLRKGTGTRESRVAEASGYIPTARERNDPRYSMALTVDIKPGETGRQANKLGLKTDSQGRPGLLMKKLSNLLESVKRGEDLTESEDLFEVKMSPTELKKWANSEEAQGIRAGFEAELIFRDTGREEQGESEPDYDADERARDIDDIIRFFQGGENGISSRTANRLRNDLYTRFQDWQSETFYDSVWNKRKYLEWVDDNIWPDVQDEYRERAQAELNLADEAELTPEQSEEIEHTAQQLFREEAERQWEAQSGWYSQAESELFDEFLDENDESEWLFDQYPYMSDIENEFGLDWPYWTEGGDREGGSRDPEDIAHSLGQTLGVRAVASSDYHSTRRRPDLWIVEPDGSLDPDDYEDTGLEVVSPPMPLPEALQKLREVIDWANNSNKGNAYTNSSTGLHMGVSIPYKGGEVDYVKLVLFMGDQYVLEQFGRAANSYAKSALEKLREVQTARRRNMSEADVRNMKGADKTAAAMDLMRRNLIELAARFVQDSVGQSKYTSAHIKDGYIEFRSPGGDYLSMDSRDEDALQNTMLRFARAMTIAGRPDLERKEYSKKLYKLLSGFKGAEISKQEDPRKPEERKSRVRYQTRIEYEDQNDAMDLFARYVSGQITPDELKKQWAQQVLSQEMPKPAGEGEYEYEVVKDVSRHPDEPARREVIDIIRANGENEADRRVRELYGDEPDYYKYSARRRRYQYDVINRDTGEVIGTIEDINLDRAIDKAWNQYGPGGENIPFDVRQRAEDEKPKKPLSRRAQVAKRIAEKPTLWTVKAMDREIFVMAPNVEQAKRAAQQQDPFFDRNRSYIDVRPATRAEQAEYRQQQEKPTLWHVSMGTSKSIVVKAHDQTGALQQAAQQDPYFASLTPHAQQFLQIRQATEDEIKQYRVQQADNEQDLEQIQRRVAPGRGRYLVKWTEFRDGQEVADSIRQDGDSPMDAMSRIRRVLELQGRSPANMQAELVDNNAPPASPAEPDTATGDMQPYNVIWTVRERYRGEDNTRHGATRISAESPRQAETIWMQGYREENPNLIDFVEVEARPAVPSPDRRSRDATPGQSTADTANPGRITSAPPSPERPEANWAVVNRVTNNPMLYFDSSTSQEAQQRFERMFSRSALSIDDYYLVPVEQPNQSQSQREYHIYHRGTGIPAVAFRAANDEAAMERLAQYRQQHPAIDVGVRRHSGPETGAAEAPPSGRPTVEIYNSRSGEVLRTVPNASSEDIITNVEQLERELGLDAGVIRYRAQQDTQLSRQGSTGQWTGNWQIRDRTGRVLHTFGGIGNNQADANRVALRWLTANGYGSGTEVEVTPEMRAEERSRSGTPTGRWEIRDAQTGEVLHVQGGLGDSQETAERYARNWLDATERDPNTPITVAREVV